jgi:superfamily II DNA or RNA helicase
VSDYADFLASKRKSVPSVGPDATPGDCHPMLHDWQAEIVAWAVHKGRAAIFADCGLGKTFMQLEWARQISDRALILAPLSVARQTVREAHKIDLDVRYVRHGSEATGPGLWITNYEMVDQFDPATFPAGVLDESSILKNVEGKTRQRLTASLADVPYRLACTATPAPNDVAELCNHAEFLGAMSRAEMLAAFFVHDEIGWRLKGHAADPMYRWMGTWAVALRRPSDAGFDDTGYDLPPLNIIPEVVAVDIEAEGQLFPTELGGIGGRSKVRRATLDARCEVAAALASRPGQWLVWCGLNDEADEIARSVEGAVNVEGTWTPDAKAEALEAFQDGRLRVLVTKPSIAGFGMNFQNCHRMIFVGLSDSYEAYYQAIRRCWRFGQTRPVDAHIVVSDLERQIVDNVRRKEDEATHSVDRLTRFTPIRKDTTDGHDLGTAPAHRRIPRRMLASTTRR